MSEILREDIDPQLMETEIQEVMEGMQKTKNFYITGPFIQANVKNGNKRSYPKEIIEREVNTHIEKKISQNRALGELGHPSSSEVNLERVCHLIKELKFDGDTVIGKALVLDTPMGKIVKSLMEGGVKIGVSTRGTGTLKNGVVQSDYRLICVDVVADPSGPNCFVNGIMENNSEWVMENGILVEKEIEEIKEDIEQAVIETQFSVEERQAAFLKIFNETLQKINLK